MKYLRQAAILLITILFAISCKNVDKVKEALKKNAKKVDSIATIVADSINYQIKGQKDTSTIPETTQQAKQQQNFNQEVIKNIYLAILKDLKTQDTLDLQQFLYFPDSVITITSQGIFQILALTPINSILADLPPVTDADSWQCQLYFEKFPVMTDSGWANNGCFIQPVKNFTNFSAILELSQEANINFSPGLLQKVKKVEPKITYKILDTYLNWTFYFVFDNNKYYLAAIDYNQY